MSKEYTDLLEAARAYAEVLHTPGADIKHFERLQDCYANTMFDCGGYYSLPVEVQEEIVSIFLKR